jgi:RNA polymerase sigma-32 factor
LLKRSTAGALDREEERRLLIAYQAGDRRALDTLVRSHLRVVRRLARKYAARFPLSVEDLEQEGVLGFVEAVDRFDLSMDNLLITYAYKYVDMRMRCYARQMSRTVKQGGTLLDKGLFFLLSHLESKHTNTSGDVDWAAFARERGTTQETLLDVRARLKVTELSFDHPVGEGTMVVGDRIAANGASPEEDAGRRLLIAKLAEAVAAAEVTMTEQQRFILRACFLSEEQPTNTAVGAQLGVSRQRVQQVQVGILAKLRPYLAPFREAA